MQFATLFLTSLSAGALALPSWHESQNSTDIILPRGQHQGMDVASYVDAACQTNASAKHYVHGYGMGEACTKLDDLTTDFIGINWGGGLNTASWVYFFLDDKCKKYGPKFQNPGKMQGTGAGKCLKMSINGGPY